MFNGGSIYFPTTARGHGSRRHLYKGEFADKRKSIVLRDCTAGDCRQAFNRTGPTGPQGRHHASGSNSNYNAYLESVAFGNRTRAEKVDKPDTFTPTHKLVLGGYITNDGGKLHGDDWMAKEKYEAARKASANG